MRTSLLCKNDGFTLMEVIVVLVLMAIFATMAVSRQPHTDMTLKAGAEVLKTHLRYAQMRAMSSDSSWGVSYDSGNYWLYHNEVTQRVTLPGETQNSVNLIAKGISISGSGVSPLVFDSRGRPNLVADATISLAKAGATETITIRRNTGFIQ